MSRGPVLIRCGDGGRVIFRDTPTGSRGGSGDWSSAGQQTALRATEEISWDRLRR